jgi:hypothetical protein
MVSNAMGMELFLAEGYVFTMRVSHIVVSTSAYIV